MSTSTLHPNHDLGARATPAAIPLPPTGLKAFGRAIWSAMEAMGQRRAAQELLRQAALWESQDPEVAKGLRASARFAMKGGA